MVLYPTGYGRETEKWSGTRRLRFKRTFFKELRWHGVACILAPNTTAKEIRIHPNSLAVVSSRQVSYYSISSKLLPPVRLPQSSSGMTGKKNRMATEVKMPANP